MFSLSMVKTFVELVLESANVSTAWCSYVKYLKVCNVGYENVNVTRRKVVFLLFESLSQKIVESLMELKFVLNETKSLTIMRISALNSILKRTCVNGFNKSSSQWYFGWGAMGRFNNCIKMGSCSRFCSQPRYGSESNSFISHFSNVDVSSNRKRNSENRSESDNVRLDWLNK